MLPRTLFTAEHDAFRQTVRRFFAEEVVPQHARWEQQGFVDRSMWLRAGALGLLCLTIPEQYGGAGADRLYCAVVIDEQAYAGASAMSFLHYTEVFANYILKYGTEAQRLHWLPKLASGRMVSTVAMTEPGTGSDLQAIATRATKEGADYVVDGSKTFISYGCTADIFLVALKTASGPGGQAEISLMLVEADRPGFSRGKPLKKIGLNGQDVCELSFSGVRVPQHNLLGPTEGRGFSMLLQELTWERLMIAISAVASAHTALVGTLTHTRDRKAFGQSVASFQNTAFKLAELKAEIAIGQVFVDRCIEAFMSGNLPEEASASAKYWASDLLCKTVDQCLQLHGGYGYMLDYPIARAFVDARVSKIYTGTNEIMKALIARNL